jgi:hypothetical protein
MSVPTAGAAMRLRWIAVHSPHSSPGWSRDRRHVPGAVRRESIDCEATTFGLRASAHPPGCHSTSPPGLATRVRMNSRSDSLLRYFAGSTLTESP